MITKKDYFIGAVAGFFTSVLLLVILSFLDVSFAYQKAAALILIPILWAGGVWLGGFLSKYFLFFAQFGKYSAAGFLSAAIDFAILNYASYLTGVTAGIVIGWVNVPGFVVAVVNGYLWNKLWVFKSQRGGLFYDFPKFAMVAVGGLIINSVLVIAFTTYIPHYLPTILLIGAERWLNVSKLVANIAVLIWNFTGFKFIVFRK